MAIAKGQSDIKYERDLVRQGFDEQIDILKNDLFQQERQLKSQLYNIQSNSIIGNEEKFSIEKPLLAEHQNIQERHIRIRRTIMIGLYAFWELSLKAIFLLKYEIIGKQIGAVKDKTKSIAWNYLNAIYEGNIPLTALDIDSSVRVLRNHLVHGKLSKNQLEHLSSFSVNHPDLHLSISFEGCYFSNYDGLLHLLDIISIELNNAELAICNVTYGTK